MSFRIEEKIFIDNSKIHLLKEWIYENGGTTLYPDRIINSIYFDNNRLQMFIDSEEGSVPRKKIRIRYYGDKPFIEQGAFTIEVKISSVEGRYKTIKKISNIDKYLKSGILDKVYGIVKPKNIVSYCRSYFQIHGQRLTIDSNIKYTKYNGFYTKKQPEIAVEIKANFSKDIDALLADFPFPRIRFSKYSKSIIALNMQP
jgi:SPX domain protein involved in polyphosphate accumulation